MLRLVVRGRKGTDGVDGAVVVDGAAGSVLMNGGELALGSGSERERERMAWVKVGAGVAKEIVREVCERGR